MSDGDHAPAEPPAAVPDAQALQLELGDLRAQVVLLEHRLEVLLRRNRRWFGVRQFGRRVNRVGRRLVTERRLRDRP
jgi:hypothetical protein